MALKKIPGKEGEQQTSTPGVKERQAHFNDQPTMGNMHFPPKRDESPPGDSKADDDQVRGRRPDKTTARVRVVGFEGKNQDGDEEEYVAYDVYVFIANLI